MKSTTSMDGSDPIMNKAKNGSLGAIAYVFLSNVAFARDSSDEDLIFANGGNFYPDTISGLAKVGIRMIKSKKRK